MRGWEKVTPADIQRLKAKAPRVEPTRSKYGVRHDEAGKLARTVDGIVFDSAAEARHYVGLMFRAQAGEIFDLELQPVYPITVAGVVVAKYRADFRYKEWVEGEGWRLVVEDVKSAATRKIPTYRLKKKLVEALYGIAIVEVT